MAAIVTITEQERAIREEAYRDAVTNLRLEGLRWTKRPNESSSGMSIARSLLKNFALPAGDSAMMIRLFQEITDPESIRPLRWAAEFLAGNRFPWNTTYLATATPGQE